MSYTASKLIAIAKAEVGYLEKKSNSSLNSKTANAGFNNYTKYARDLYNAGYYNGNKNGYAWCDVFVDWCFYQLCDKNIKKAEEIICQTGDYGAGCDYSAKYYQNKGRLFKDPKPGDQIFFWNSKKTSIAHTGIVVAVNKTYVYTVEGNTSSSSGVVANGGAVEAKKYKLNYYRIYKYGRPKYDEEDLVISSILTIGSSGSEVKKLQENLIKLGYSCGKYGADGDFGSDTESALKKFQKENNLTVDGKYGEKSKAKLESLILKTEPAVSISSNKIDTIKEVQNWANKHYGVNLTVDGVYGAKTKVALVKILQRELNQTYGEKLLVDGVFGAKTKAACRTLKVGAKNDVVGVLQALLICKGYKNAYLDKDFGSGTESAVKAFKRKVGLSINGIADKNTFAKLCK